MRTRLYAILTLLLCLIWQSCSPEKNGREQSYTVAVVVPLSGDTADQWRSTAEWAVDNIDKAQLGLTSRVHLNVEFHDEDSEDILTLGASLAERKDIKAIVGPVDQNRLANMASAVRRCGKPLLAISAGSTDLVRKYVERNDFFWAMTQTDISQCEVMLSTAAQAGCRQFTLVCNDDNIVCQTFKDWFPFQVTELGLEVEGNLLYASADEIPALMEKAIHSEHGTKEAIICVPADETEARMMLQQADRLLQSIPTDRQPRIYFSSNVVQMPIKAMNLSFDFYTVYPFADPQSGFYSAFYAHTGKTSFTFEAQLYDALMITALGLAHDAASLKSSMIEITGNLGPELRTWTSEAMSLAFSEIANGGLKHHVTGASSNLWMDTDNHTCVTASHFIYCYCQKGIFFPISYYSPNGGGQSSSILGDWNWQITNIPEIEASSKTFSYPELDQRWAVVIAGSSGFENYRHQADALNMYRHLLDSGYDDDHILLIMADDIANDPRNTRPGIISIYPDSEDLYAGAKVDYLLKDLDLENLLEKIATLPCDANDNVLLFWSGHGSPNGLIFKDELCPPEMLKDLMEKMQGRYRKMLWLVETCYSGLVGEAVEGYPGVIAMTAANANETSKADEYNSEMNIWMSNRFTIYFIETQKVSPLTIREMYYYLCLHTLGSHPCLFNSANYDDITTADFKEYMN